MFNAYDFFGKDINLGDRVLYTTSAEGSSMTLGRVLDIYISNPQYGSKTHKIKVQPLGNDNNPKMVEKWVGGFPKGDRRNWVEKQARPSLLDYFSNKFYRLSDDDIALWDEE